MKLWREWGYAKNIHVLHVPSRQSWILKYGWWRQQMYRCKACKNRFRESFRVACICRHPLPSFKDHVSKLDLALWMCPDTIFSCDKKCGKSKIMVMYFKIGKSEKSFRLVATLGQWSRSHLTAVIQQKADTRDRTIHCQKLPRTRIKWKAWKMRMVTRLPWWSQWAMLRSKLKSEAGDQQQRRKVKKCQQCPKQAL